MIVTVTMKTGLTIFHPSTLLDHASSFEELSVEHRCQGVLLKGRFFLIVHNLFVCFCLHSIAVKLQYR